MSEGLLTRTHRGQRGLADDPERHRAGILAHESELRDRQRMPAVDVVEASLQQRHDRAATLGVDRTRQGQVAPEVFKRVRLAPSIKLLDLARAYTGAQSLLPYVRGERTTKSVEGHHAGRCQPIEREARLGRYDGNESRERSDDRLDRRQRS